MTDFSETRKRVADGAVCPECGKDVQPEEVYREVAHSIGEIYHHPACADCGIYTNHYKPRETEWYPDEPTADRFK